MIERGMRTSVRVCSLLAILVLGGLAVLQAWVYASGDRSGYHGVRNHVAVACGSQASSMIGIIGKVAPGHSAQELEGVGYSVYPAVASSSEAIAGTSDDLLAINPTRADGRRVDLATLNSSAALMAVGAVQAQSANLALRSCDYRLSDSAAAQEIAAQAESLFVSRRLATSAQLADPGTILLISDDPLDPGQIVFTAAIPGAIEGIGAPAGARRHDAIVAFLQLTAQGAATIVAPSNETRAGFGAWYRPGP